MRELTIALLLCATVAHGGEEKAKAKAYYEEGMKRFNLGDYADAVTNFKNGYLVKPDPVFLFNLAQAYRMMGDVAGAAREYRAYLREMPSAANRSAVEKFLADAEEELRRRSAIVPPTGTLPLHESEPPPPNPTPVAPAPIAEPHDAPPPTVVPASPPEPRLDPLPTVASAPPASPVDRAPESPRPVYRRGWFWGVLIAVVVVAAGAATLAVVAAPKDAPVPSTTGGVYAVAF